MRTCVNCGAAMRDAARFCPACGHQSEPPVALSQPEAALSPGVTILPHEPAAAPAAAVPVCAACHQMVKEGARFCGACGAQVQRPASDSPACVSCGAPLKPNARFCGECGSSTAAMEHPVAAEGRDEIVDATALTMLMSPQATVVMPCEGVQTPDGRAEGPADDEDIGEQPTGDLAAAREQCPAPPAGLDTCEGPAGPVAEASEEVMSASTRTTAFEEDVLARLTAIEARLDEILRAPREAQ